MVRGALVAVLLVLAAGCGGTDKANNQAGAAGDVVLEKACPGAHLSYDSLVASNPASQKAFVDQLQQLWIELDEEAREALSPVIKAAKTLEKAGRGPGFDDAQDGVYSSIVGLDADCRKVGSLILH